MKANAALVTALLLLAGVGSADARTAPNPGGRAVRDPGLAPAGAVASAPAPAALAVPRAAQAVDVPLPAGAVAIDSTYYDLQDMGSLGSRIVVGADGRVHVTWQDDFCELDPNGCPPNLNLPQPYPFRGMGYAYRDVAGTWHDVTKVRDPTIHCTQCVPEEFGGFGALAVTPDGRAAVAQHMNEDGCDLRGDFYLESAPGASTWRAYLSPIISPSYLFPQVVTAPNGSFVVLGEVPRGGSYDETESFRVSRLAAAGAAFVCPTGWQNGPWTAVGSPSLYRDGRPAFPCIAVSSNGRVGIAVTDFGGNVYLIESSDGTFGAGTVTIRNLTNYSDAQIVVSDSTSTQYRPFVNCHVAYNDTTPNVVWAELQARKSGASIAYFDHRSRIRHWNSLRGLTAVKQVQAGEADRYDDVDQGLAGPLAGFNTLSVDWPEVGFSADGAETYVAWLRFVDSQVDPTADAGLPGIVTGTGFGDIALSVARGNDPWSAPQNLTNTPTTDERFFSLAARNPGGRARIVFQASATNQAGSAVIGDRGTSPGNLRRRVAYLEAPIAGSLVSVGDLASPARAALQVHPNPARGSVSFTLARPLAAGGAIGVFSPNGRRIARLEIAAGAAARWDGRDAQGRRVPSGLYFARLEGDGSGTAAKFLLLH